MPPIPHQIQSDNADNATLPRIVMYQQTYFHKDEYVSMLPLLEENTAVTHVILAAIHINENPNALTLNDDPFDAEQNDFVWQEVMILQSAGIKVLGMLGGAAKGSYKRLDGDLATFFKYYEPLRHMIETTGLEGLDLDVEEDMSLSGIIRLIDQLKLDFGKEFIITLAPVATALQGRRHLSGFDYEALEKAFGRHIDWYNTQFYCGWGSAADISGYDEIIRRGWPAEKVVLGLMTNPEGDQGWIPDDLLTDTLNALKSKYPTFGGVMGWEYWGSMTAAEPYGWPWSWANLMTKILRPDRRIEGDANPTTQQNEKPEIALIKQP